MKKKRLPIEEYWWKMVNNGNVDPFELRAMIWMAQDQELKDKATQRLLALVKESDLERIRQDIRLIILWNPRMRKGVWKKWKHIFDDENLKFLWAWCHPLRQEIERFKPELFKEKN